MTKRINSYLKLILLAAGCAVFTTPAQASLVSENLVFTFSQPSTSHLFTDNRTVVDPGAELTAGDGTSIGGDVLLSGSSGSSSIDVMSHSIVFTLRGGGAIHSAGYQTTGAAADGKFRLSGFSASLHSLFEITGGDMFALELNDMIGVSLGNELVVNNNSVAANNYIDLFIGALGINATNDIGSVTLKVVRDTTPPNVVPIPAALPLMLSALALLGFMTRRRRTA